MRRKKTTNLQLYFQGKGKLQVIDVVNVNGTKMAAAGRDPAVTVGVVGAPSSGICKNGPQVR
jgi:hypothetical protein